MDEAWRKYDLGDVVTARRLAKQVLAGSPSADIAGQANDLLQRTRTPVEAFYFAALAAVLIAVMVVLAIRSS
jgi:hypothetical protein